MYVIKHSCLLLWLRKCCSFLARSLHFKLNFKGVVRQFHHKHLQFSTSLVYSYTSAKQCRKKLHATVFHFIEIVQNNFKHINQLSDIFGNKTFYWITLGIHTRIKTFSKYGAHLDPPAIKCYTSFPIALEPAHQLDDTDFTKHTCLYSRCKCILHACIFEVYHFAPLGCKHSVEYMQLL